MSAAIRSNYRYFRGAERIWGLLVFLIQRIGGNGAVTASNSGAGAGGDAAEAGAPFSLALAGLETAILDACATETEWPAQIAAAICAGVDFALENPIAARALTLDATAEADYPTTYERVVDRLVRFIQIKAPADKRLPGPTDETLLTGVVGLVGDHIRLGRIDRLVELRPELVLMTLLPYLGFEEAKRWADRVAGTSPA